MRLGRCRRHADPQREVAERDAGAEAHHVALRRIGARIHDAVDAVLGASVVVGVRAAAAIGAVGSVAAFEQVVPAGARERVVATAAAQRVAQVGAAF